MDYALELMRETKEVVAVVVRAMSVFGLTLVALAAGVLISLSGDAQALSEAVSVATLAMLLALSFHLVHIGAKKQALYAFGSAIGAYVAQWVPASIITIYANSIIFDLAVIIFAIIIWQGAKHERQEG